ncbi:MAG: hypothetical protein ACKOEM_17955 [Planctomycetia bacterium]
MTPTDERRLHEVFRPYARFDLGLKAALAERVRHGLVSSQVRYEYLSHLATWNGLAEPGSTKVGAEAFLQTLAGLVESFSRERRFTAPPIRVSPDGLLQNGVHRLAAALACGVEPTIEVVEGPAANYDCFYFFRFTSPLGQTRFTRRSLIHMLYRNVTLWRDRIRTAIVFPRGHARDAGARAAEAIAEQGVLLWDETISVPGAFLKYLVLNAYPGEPWTGVGSAKDGVGRKTASVVTMPSGPHALRVLVFVPHADADVTALKQEIRNFYGMGNDALHISSGPYDSFSLATAFCSSVSDLSPLQHLAYSSPRLAEVLALAKTLSTQSPHIERCMLVGSAALELYGGRPANDLDFVGAGLPTIDQAYTGHNAYAYLYETEIADLVDSLEGRFFFGGLPAAAPGMVLGFKERRNEHKDRLDVAQMRGIFANRGGASRPTSPT